MPIEGTVTGQVLRSRRSERLTDAREALHVSQELLGLEADTALLVPLAFRGRPVGVLIATGPMGGTEIPGVWAAGNAGDLSAMVSSASADPSRGRPPPQGR